MIPTVIDGVNAIDRNGEVQMGLIMMRVPTVDRS